MPDISTAFQIENDYEPFALHPHSISRHANLSIESLALLPYLLSHNLDKYEIKLSFVIKHFQGRMCKDRIYRTVKELINEGYIQRTDFLEDGKKRCRYKVSSKPKFKKCLLFPEIQDTEIPHTKEEQVSTNVDKEEKIYKKRSQQVAPVSAEAEKFTSFFYEKLKEINPKIEKQNLGGWAKSIGTGMKRDNRSIEELTDVINFLVKESKEPPAKFKWCDVVKSPNKLFQHFSSVWKKMNNDFEAPENLVEKNTQKAQSIADRFPGRHDINVGKEFIEFTEGSYSNLVWYKQTDFDGQCQKEMNRRKLYYEGILDK